jgi:hypothetical protein
MSASLYCEIDGVEHGPLSTAQLKKLADDGQLQPTDSVWKTGMQTKIPARMIKGLFDGAPVAAAVVEEEADEEKHARKTARDQDSEEEEEEEEEEDEPEPELLAEVSVTYREGLPDVPGPQVAVLYVESTGLRFSFDNKDEDDFIISFEKIDHVLEPARGDFPQAMKKKAMAAKVGGKVGKLAAGLVGGMIGGDAGTIVSKVGGGASQMAEDQGALGTTPRNRITVIAYLRKKRRKVRFDANGDSTEDMNAEAKALYKHIKKARERFAPDSDYEEVGDDTETDRVPLSGAQEEDDPGDARPAGLAALSPATFGPGKPFRVMHAGRVSAPCSLEELRAMFDSGKIKADDLIGVETWLPVSTLAGLLGSAARAGGKDGEASRASPPMPADDGDTIPIDDQYKL